MLKHKKTIIIINYFIFRLVPLIKTCLYQISYESAWAGPTQMYVGNIIPKSLTCTFEWENWSFLDRRSIHTITKSDQF